MKRKLGLRTLTICMVLMALLTACGEKDNGPTGPGGGGETGTKPDMATLTQATHTITMPAEADLTTYTETQITYAPGDIVTAYSLDQFVDKSVTDDLTNISNATESRALFAYRMIASDDFDPWTARGYDDLLWDVFNQGYLVPSKSFRSFFDPETVNIENAYNVKNLQILALFRTITVVKPTGTEEVIFEIGALPTSQPLTHLTPPSDELAIKLTDLITTYITSTPANYDYIFTDPSADGFPQTYTWAEMQAGYFLLETERTTFPTIEGMPGSKARYKNIMKITLVAPTV